MQTAEKKEYVDHISLRDDKEREKLIVAIKTKANTLGLDAKRNIVKLAVKMTADERLEAQKDLNGTPIILQWMYKNIDDKVNEFMFHAFQIACNETYKKIETSLGAQHGALIAQKTYRYLTNNDDVKGNDDNPHRYGSEKASTGTLVLNITYGDSSSGAGHTVSLLLCIDKDCKKSIYLCPSSNDIGTRKPQLTDAEYKKRKEEIDNGASCLAKECGKAAAYSTLDSTISTTPLRTKKDAINDFFDNKAWKLKTYLISHGWQNAIADATVLQPCNQWSNVSCAFAATIGSLRVAFGDRTVQDCTTHEANHLAQVAQNYIDIAAFVSGTEQEIQDVLLRIYCYAQTQPNHVEVENPFKGIGDDQLKQHVEEYRKTHVAAQSNKANAVGMSAPIQQSHDQSALDRGNITSCSNNVEATMPINKQTYIAPPPQINLGDDFSQAQDVINTVQAITPLAGQKDMTEAVAEHARKKNSSTAEQLHSNDASNETPQNQVCVAGASGHDMTETSIGQLPVLVKQHQVPHKEYNNEKVDKIINNTNAQALITPFAGQKDMTKVQLGLFIGKGNDNCEIAATQNITTEQSKKQNQSTPLLSKVFKSCGYLATAGFAACTILTIVGVAIKNDKLKAVGVAGLAVSLLICVASAAVFYKTKEGPSTNLNPYNVENASQHNHQVQI